MKNTSGAEIKTASKRKPGGIGLLILFAGAAVMVFHALWKPGAVLMVSDFNLGVVAAHRRILMSTPLSNWTGDILWGLPGISGLHVWALLIRILTPETFMNLYHGFCLMMSAWFLAMYLKDKRLSPAACVFGGLTAFWVGTNLTLTYAGHIGKYGTMMFLALSVFALGRWGKTGRAAWAVLAGTAAGAMYLEQPDVSFFNTLLLAPLGLYEGVRAVRGFRIGPLVRQVCGGVLAGALLAGGTSLAARASGVEEVPGGEDSAARWAYLTQWSQPPGESLDFIAPGWTGWRSGEPGGPYWGRMGRSENWEETGQGLMNFKLENVYVGAIPFLFALIGAAEAFRRRREDENASAVFVWSGLCILALLLSFGKFFPLYRPLSLLPGFSSIRNPNKFIHFFQMAWGAAAAFGLDAVWRMEKRNIKRWIGAAVFAAALLLLSGAALWINLDSGAARLAAAGWGPAGRVIQWNKAFAVTYAGGAFVLGAVILWLMRRSAFYDAGKKPTASARKTPWVRAALLAAWLPAVVVVFDAAVILAPKYIQTMPPGYTAENDLVRYLKSELGHNRAAMASQEGFYNLWLTYLFPYHGIPAVNVTQLPRPPPDYMAFWSAVRDPVRVWRLTAVSHVLARAEAAGQLLANPDWAGQLDAVWSYQVFNAGRGGVGTRPLADRKQASDTVLKLTPVPPRVAVIHSWLTLSDDQALQTLADPAFEPFSTVLIPPGNGLPSPPEAPEEPASVKITRLTPGRYKFTVETAAPAMVRVAEKYDPGWKASIDSRSVPVRRVDYMFQGVFIDEPGRHRISMRYTPSSLPVLMQTAGLLTGLGAVVILLIRRKGTL